MKKIMFKKVLSIIDYIELHGISKEDTNSAILKQLEKDEGNTIPYTISKCLDFLWRHHFIKETAHGIDLTPSATIFAKADANSRVEALSLFESLYQSVETREVLQSLLQQKIHKLDFYSYLDEYAYSLLTQTSLLFKEDDYVSLRQDYKDDILSIVDEYGNGSLLLSTTLLARYTTSIIPHENRSIEYKNQSLNIVPYPSLPTILSILPRLGVPIDRNHSKSLQSFYKDTLFHECDHACPICGIDLPHLLVASHIKPFRDCAHIYEAIDHNNGLLLCRNHDYIFDQGYISFQDDGLLLISNELMIKENEFAYALSTSYHLPTELLSVERKLFLAYHREHIFKKKR